jgi:hypothetical protein
MFVCGRPSVTVTCPPGSASELVPLYAKHLSRSSLLLPFVQIAERSLTADIGDKLFAALDKHWDSSHLVVRHAECHELPQTSRKQSLCYSAGFCLHTPHGRKLALFEAAFIKNLQNVFLPKSVERRLLKAGFLVLELVGAVGGSVFFHVCHANFTSGNWKIALLRVEKQDHIGNDLIVQV